ncbi:response regulator RpfG family c-di-GMP phosphodiesterase [Paucibacter oligotrophus]|uniref:Response regulator RpfG family c-di-GMP phosphodiesterase n=1 Tax=Roseateles oligotrophus TaxID=1769250 RepID=A0A840LF46_9BURK|nr:HD domain-containing phosphohydrolase [Roseateles oligotrophus]MBB4844818.1 response regulator RpfG family c-di-GMP phosphodiesterase [Roseateles oligotrophus]
MTESAIEQAVILCVDDEPSILSALRRLLRPQGYKVLMAESGAAGLALLEQEAVALVISDMRMPVMDGAQFLEQVRLRWPGTIRILLTGYADVGSTIAAINRGEIHRYVAKPWDDQNMLLTVADGLNRRRLEQENAALLSLTQRQNEELQSLNAGLEARVKARTQEIEQINAMLEQAYAQLQDNFLLSINVFAGLTELRDGSLAGYSRQVAQLAQLTARRLKLGRSVEQDVYIAGLLHEVGKIGFPDAMLRKPMSVLVGEELLRFKRHTLSAEAALMPLAQLQKAARHVRSQHERLDGKGFPDGLKGPDLPQATQALAVAADYMGLQSGRLAERRYSAAEALALIRGGAGTRYEEQVVEAFGEALKEKAETVSDDRLLNATELEEGMVLARDLTSPQGTLLLAAGFVFDARVVRQVREFAQREGAKLQLYIRRSDARQPAASDAIPRL